MNKPPFGVTGWSVDFKNRNLDKDVYFSDPLQKILTVSFEFVNAAELDEFRRVVQANQTFKWDLPVASLSGRQELTTFEGVIEKACIVQKDRNLPEGQITCFVY